MSVECFCMHHHSTGRNRLIIDTAPVICAHITLNDTEIFTKGFDHALIVIHRHAKLICRINTGFSCFAAGSIGSLQPFGKQGGWLVFRHSFYIGIQLIFDDLPRIVFDRRTSKSIHIIPSAVVTDIFQVRAQIFRHMLCHITDNNTECASFTKTAADISCIEHCFYRSQWIFIICRLKQAGNACVIRFAQSTSHRIKIKACVLCCIICGSTVFCYCIRCFCLGY